MMTDPAFAIKHEVLQLVEIQIETLRKPSSLTSSDLNEYHLRSKKLALLYNELDLIVRKRFTKASQPAA
jgi:hypothetical protein